MIADLIQDFQTRLMVQVPELLYIDEDWGQLDYYDKFPLVKFPCALIDIQNATFTNDGELAQRGVLTVVVKLYLLRLSNTSNAAPQSQKNNAKKGWAIYEKVNRALHGQDFLPVGFAAPIRQSMQRVKRADGVYQRDITYTIGFSDNTTVPVRPITPARPTIKAAIETV
ncbi:hypothetical protein D0T49_00295 [Paludibacter sp. 221]|uniref:hypothetical protein n=1 Tax=Paludibacter sp. 221 TaxID=2302939 RepID=UPI0013D75DC4|nr:hypothetical protein [Paludibacter sp. 221]NDV45492.1 hypothetical protein [Paludibacter sp. 221]